MDSDTFTKTKDAESDMVNITTVESLDLAGLGNDKKPVKERLATVSHAISLYHRLRDDDRCRSINRARIDAMFDGEAPYTDEQLRATGQPDKTNLNFGEAQRQLDIALSAYVDLFASVETLVEVKSSNVNDKDRMSKEGVVAEELSTMMRKHPAFHSTYMQLCTTFNKHGICPTFFDDPTSWMYQTGALDDFLFPSQTVANEDCVDVVIIRKSYPLHEVMAFINAEEKATSIGWDVDETKRVVMNNVRTQIDSLNGEEIGYQKIQAYIKNNDVSFGHTNPQVKLLHFLVKEMDGSMSHYICSQDTPKTYMFKGLSRYTKGGSPFTIFTLGVGTNGTYHSVRGLGQRIFAHIHTSNRLRCQMVDGATLAASVMIQPENNRAIEELEFSFYGAYSVLSPNVKIIEKAIPDLGQSVVPALEDMANQLAANTDTVSTYGQRGSSPYRNETQVVSDMDVATRISGSAINLFYVSWSRLMKEVVRRILKTDRSKDMLVNSFYDMCEMRGVDEGFIASMDESMTKAVRAVGGGSAANRSIILRELQALAPSFDEVGRQNLVRDTVASRVGQEAADRYAPKTEGERTTSDDKIVFFENNQLSQGVQVPVLDNELHGKHINSHLEPLNQILQAIDSGEADPVQAITVLQVYHEHVSAHIEMGFGDPGLSSLVAQARQVLQIAEEAIHNTSKHIQKLEREQQEQAGQEQAGQVPPEHQQAEIPAHELKLQAHEVDMRIKEEKAQLDRSIQEQKFQQEQALKDAKTAIELQEDLRNGDNTQIT